MVIVGRSVVGAARRGLPLVRVLGEVAARMRSRPPSSSITSPSRLGD